MTPLPEHGLEVPEENSVRPLPDSQTRVSRPGMLSFPWLPTFIFHVPGKVLWKVTIQDPSSFRMMLVVGKPFREHRVLDTWLFKNSFNLVPCMK
jgi:hypothetical protein